MYRARTWIYTTTRWCEVHVGDNGKTVVAESETKYEVKMLVESADAVRDLFWGDSSMAVIFGVCRDWPMSIKKQ